MQFPFPTQRITCVAVPVSALKSTHSCGIGEFADLVPFAEFCKKSALSMIQLLPVNDTGTESSPYSALSAFALHPLYLSIRDIPEGTPYHHDIGEIKNRFESLPRFDYRGLRLAKMDLLRRIFDDNEKSILKDPALQDWIIKNPWICEYAVFMNLKHRFCEASWKQWDKMRTPSHGEIQDRWNSPKRKADHLFYAWLQMRLDEQFSKAVSQCAALGIAIKGDIPILMNEDSCDAWANPEFFRDDLRAGSPPDDMNQLGQNWGFPIYNWDNLRDTGFSWWKERLSVASRYYHAYRIDHILGFFRIWSIPSGNSTGYLGWTTPHEAITTPELHGLGFSGDRLRWITEPHIPTSAIEAVNHFDYLGSHGLLSKVCNRIGNEELWLFKPTITGERDIEKANLPQPVIEALLYAWKDRLLQETGRDDKGRALYSPIWNWKDTSAWKSLSSEEKESMGALFERKKAEGEQLWEAQALEILGELTRSCDMLPCAEDLGSIPQCVPSVLSQLGILSLKVVRWERIWELEGQPLRDLGSYPSLSVAASSVHDSSTLRMWWDSEGGREAFYAAYGSEGFTQDYCESTASAVLERIAQAGSRIVSIPLQDFLALSSDTTAQNPNDERINIPGTVSPFNWTWRLPLNLESLIKNHHLTQAIAAICAAHQKESATGGKI